MIDAGPSRDPAEVLRERGWACEFYGDSLPQGEGPPTLVATVDRVKVTIPHRDLRTPVHPDESEVREFRRLFEATIARFRPEVLVTYGGDALTREMTSRARRANIATVFHLHNFAYRDRGPFENIDYVIAPSAFSSRYYRAALGLDCTVLPGIIDWKSIQGEPSEANSAYVTFVNPAIEKGVYAFARIAEELGRRRPDITLLVVEGRGTEATLIGCGLDLKPNGNVHVMSPTPDPRDFWGKTRVCLMPSLWWESQGLVALEAMANGIPVVASDRGALPETLGGAGVVLPLPDRMTPSTRFLPSVEEITPWLDAVIRLWDDDNYHAKHRRLAREEVARKRTEDPAESAARFFRQVGPGRIGADFGREARSGWVVIVPFLHAIEFECDESLRRLESSGVTVVRCRGSSAIDIVRNTLASQALQRGCESILFIDADIGFDPADALRLLARPEPVVAGVYMKKGKPELASSFDPELDEVVFGPSVPGLYPLEYAAGGFLRIKTDVLRRLIEGLGLPLCNARWEAGYWPFFLPMIIPLGNDGDSHYLSEDYAFSHRLRQIGITPMADTSIRLSHIGSYGYTWDDSGQAKKAIGNHVFMINKPNPAGI